MRNRITRIAERSFLPLSMVFLLIIVLNNTGIISLPFDIRFLIIILPLTAALGLCWYKPRDHEQRIPFIPVILAILFLFTLAIRLLPLFKSPVPLGYDSGFYKYTMEFYFNALPQIPETALADWVKDMYPQGLFVLSDIMNIISGTVSMDNIYYLFPLFEALMLLPVFIVTRKMFGPKAGLLAAILYSFSLTQYESFTMLYFKTTFGMMFLLFAIYALEEKKYALMAIMFAALGIFHRPEFLLFAIILIPFFILNRKVGIILSVIGTVVLITPFWLPRLDIYMETLLSAFSGMGEVGSSGTFYGMGTYLLSTLAYLPFSIIGVVYLIINKKWNSVLFYSIINLAIVVFRLFFFNRMIIPLDIIMIILAALGIERTLLNREVTNRVLGSAAVIILLIATLLPTINKAINTEPLITEKQLDVIEWMSENTEEDAFILATSYDAPWVLGWSNRRVIAPGLFEWNAQNKQEWFDFFKANDPIEAAEFLSLYEGTIYIYHSHNHNNNLGLEKFSGEPFELIIEYDAVVYRYRR
ncbi:hypothetical protein ACFLXY_10350 [Chloroflexota bacterium]